MKTLQSITFRGHTFRPIASPGPCTVCGEPATGYTRVGTESKEWELCDRPDCWAKVNAEAEAEAESK